MLRIRMRREGSRNHPFYRLVVSDSRRTPNGPVTETIGTYNPKGSPTALAIDWDRYDAWLAKGAHPSETVAALAKRSRKAAKATS